MKPSLLPAALLLLLLLFACPAGAQAPPPPDLDGYRRLVERAVELVEQKQPEQAADLLAGVTAVALPSGEIVSVDHAGLERALRHSAGRLPAARQRLEALRYKLEHWPSATVAPDAFATLDRVLAQPQFAPLVVPDLDLPVWLFELFDALATPSILVAVALLAGVLAYFAMALWGSFAARAGAEGDADGEGTAPLTAAQALARSRDLAGAGDYRTAIRLLYLSTLLFLEERNRLRYDRTLTNREYLRQVAGQAELSGALRPVVDTFDEVWYGEIEPDAGRYESYAQQVDHLREAAE